MQHVVALVVAIAIAVAVTLTLDDRDTTLPYVPSANCIYLLSNLAPAGVRGPLGHCLTPSFCITRGLPQYI
ncbi:hypothetical protein CSPX01_05631 [Colletotrichum filicis]|nr:hypothetical protein CSPX01_05631 [Colletotrichum filicis]